MATNRLLKNYCGMPSAALRGARFLAYLFDMSRSLRSARLASGHPRSVFQQPAHLPTYALLLSALLAGIALSGCSSDSGTGPAQVRWDRTTCDRCRMLLSDHKHAAQVRVKEAEGRSQVYFFDDIGCAMVWLEDKPWRQQPATEIWVNDRHDGQWLDARRAFYVRGQTTPMEYGLGAQSNPVPEALDFAAARNHVLAVEQRFNQAPPPARKPAP